MDDVHEGVERIQNIDRGLSGRLMARDALFSLLRIRHRAATTRYVTTVRVRNLASINGYHGIGVGDRVLAQVEKAIIDAMPGDQKNVARVAGAFYLIVHKELEEEALVQHVDTLERLLNGLVSEVDQMPLRPHTVITTLELSREGELVPEDIVRFLQEASVVDRGETSQRSFLPSSNSTEADMERVHRRSENALLVAQALQEGKVDVHFQPVVDINDGRLFDVEALARIHYNGRVLPASEFIEEVYGIGEILELDSLVFSRIVDYGHQLAEVTERLFVNVSPISLRSQRFRDHMAASIDVLRADGIDLVVVLELTEQALLRHLDLVVELSRSLDVRFAVDDFGTGYSSLKTVADLAVEKAISYLKIDGSLIREMPTSKEAYTIVLAIVNMCKSLELEVIAEYVCDAKVLASLRTTGIRLAQGFFYSRPLTIEQLIERYTGKIADRTPRFRVAQLAVLEPYLGKAFGAFYDTLLNDGHFASHFRDQAHIDGLIIRQQASFSASLSEPESARCERYVQLGTLHQRVGIPFATFMKGTDILEDELLEVLVAISNDGFLIQNTQRFFQRMKDHLALGYLLPMITEEVAALHTLRDLVGEGIIGQSLGQRLIACPLHISQAVREGQAGEVVSVVAEQCSLAPWLTHLSQAGVISDERRADLERRHRALELEATNLAYFLEREEYAAVLPIYLDIMRGFHGLATMLIMLMR